MEAALVQVRDERLDRGGGERLGEELRAQVGVAVVVLPGAAEPGEEALGVARAARPRTPPRRALPSAATSARASASGPAKAPNTLTCSGGVVMSRLAASASGASGAHACQAAIAAAGSSQNVSKAVITGSRTVAISSAVTTPKRAPPAPRSAHSRSSSASTTLPSASTTSAARTLSASSP